MAYELTNDQRKYLGLELVNPSWEKVYLKAGPYQSESHLYYDGDVLKKQIISNENKYHEQEFDLKTIDREIIPSKTGKGKPKKLTAAVLEKAKATGVYFFCSYGGHISIANNNTQLTYYSTQLEDIKIASVEELEKWLNQYIEESPPGYLDEINTFKNAKRKHVKYKTGDFFKYRLTRTKYGYGRILLDINAVRNKGLVPKDHGLYLLMGPPLLIKLYTKTSESGDPDLTELADSPALPGDYIMDNKLYYGEYEIIGNLPVREEEVDFPISFGRSIDPNRKELFLQWGLINLTTTKNKLSDLVQVENPLDELPKLINNAYGFYSIGFSPHYDASNILNNDSEEGGFSCLKEDRKSYFDLRNPKNDAVRSRILKGFKLDPNKSYTENCVLTKTISTQELISQL